ncbi:MAG: AAA family ATPase [Promethearchaeota archaeon]
MAAPSQIMSILRDVYISKVILENFLSFEKDEIDFEDAKFNLVIGPNWSGKTSIFQAIKFGLGSNERDERYSKWSDFIRNGQKHAMVELHINNRGRMVKIQRTVIRGKSPFFSMQEKGKKSFKRVSSKEIQKLVKEFNFNPDNHFAFVSQGKIDSIKSLKPIELCNFLEEGIGLKSLRDEILQQKNDVKSLQSELNSIITKKNTLNIGLDLLRPKLERLEEKKKLLKKKIEFEDELLWANKKIIQEEIDKINELIVKTKVNIDIINYEIRTCNDELEKFQRRIDEIGVNINDYSMKIGELSYKKKELVKKIENWQKNKIQVKQELEKLNEFLAQKEKILNNHISKRESVKKETNLIKDEISKLEGVIDNLIDEQATLTKKIEQNKEFLDAYNQITTDKNKKLKEIEDFKTIIKEINSEINQIFQSLKDIDHKLELNKWFLENPTKDLLGRFNNELGKVSAKIFSLENAIEQMEQTRIKKIRKLKPLQASLRERKVILPTNITILKEEIEKRELNAKGPIIDYIKYDDSLSYAIESVLGEKLLYSFVVDNWDTLELIKRLKNKYNAYCNIYVPKNLKVLPLMKISARGIIGYLAELIKIVDDDEDIKKVIYSKVTNCLVAKDFIAGKELYKNHDFKGKCVTLKGEQIISYKYVYETPFIKQLKGTLSVGTQKEQSELLESEIKRLNENISNFRVDLSKLDNIQKEIYKKKEAFNDLLYNFNQKQRLTNKKNELYEKIYAHEELIKENEEKINNLDLKISELEAQKDPDFFKIIHRIKRIPKELTELNDKKKKWILKEKVNQKVLNEMEQKVTLLETEVNTIKKEYDDKKSEFQKADKNAFKIYQELETIENNIDESEEKILKLKEEVNKIKTEKMELDKKNIQLNIDFEQENITLNSLNTDIDTKKRALERINRQLKDVEDFQPRSIELIQEDLMKIEKKLLKYMDVDDSLLVERDQILNSLKKIAKNQKDLENDIKSAMKTENKLEDAYYEKFKVVLNDLKSKINFKFESSQIKSYCSLELVGNFEELGVKIKAATSKDQLKTFSALSGGQISMIAICLMLSLQEIKPSPLCMFDEAGMFLDDKNAEVSYQLIKSTLEQNPIQMIMFLPKTSNKLYLLADKIIGVARVGKKELSTIFKPKLITEVE